MRQYHILHNDALLARVTTMESAAAVVRLIMVTAVLDGQTVDRVVIRVANE